jgi:hypothetical protein
MFLNRSLTNARHRTALATLFTLATLTLAPALAQSGRPILSSYLGTTPMLDGVLAAGEWDDATSFTGVRDWIPEFTPVTHDADLSLHGFVKHDAEWLYFAFVVTDDLLYGIDTDRWLPDENRKAHALTREGFPWFGDEMELLINATGRWNGDEGAEGNGSSWQMVCNLTKSRLGGIGIGGLLEGEPRSDPAAWNTYAAWIRDGAQKAVAKANPEGGGYVIEWAVRFNPCLEISPGKFYTPTDNPADVGLNIAVGDLDQKMPGNFGGFHHEQWFSGEPHLRTQKRQWGTLRLMGTTRKPGPARAKADVRINSPAVARVIPDHGISGEFGTWTVVYQVGPDGIHTGGGIRVQLPDSWHAGPRNSANRLQTTDPRDEHYVTGAASAEGVVLKTIVESERNDPLIKHAKTSLDGRSERYVFVVRVQVTRGELKPGDTLSVTYGDRSAGSTGYRVGAVSTDPEPVLIAVDTRGTGTFQLHQPSPTIQALPGEAVELLFHGPSQGTVGVPVQMLLSILDKEQNPSTRSERITLSVVSGRADVPATVDLALGSGHARFPLTPLAPGIIRLRAVTRELGLTADSNPMRVTPEPPAASIYWGDLHSHARRSWDGVGDHSFDYARNVTGLDFYALTDHSVAPPSPTLTRGLSGTSWKEYNDQTEQFNDPPRFVTLHAYECSFEKPYGHHNVYFRNEPGPLANPSQVTLPELWDLLKQGDALTIPHHTGKFPAEIDFSIHNPHFRRNFEIYSGHGLSEAFDPAHPLSFEHSTFTSPSTSLDGPSHAQDAWALGLILSTIASSDDHRAHPGQPNLGLVAVRAPALSRDNVFQALHDRQTYATTGARIILDFTVNGVPMGSNVVVDSIPEIRIAAIGTDTIAKVELLKFQKPAKHFVVVEKWRPDSAEFDVTLQDAAFESGAIYYVRLEQRRNVRDRMAMAWSSPIWTNSPRR